MNVLVLNCGSSTVKFQLIATDLDRIARGQGRAARARADRAHRGRGDHHLHAAGRDRGARRRRCATRARRSSRSSAGSLPKGSGIGAVKSVADVHAVGHRVVHGGERFTQSVLITTRCCAASRIASSWRRSTTRRTSAASRRRAKSSAPGLPQAAVFDTAFHQTLPEHAYLYALPYQWYRRHRIRRYGFHGTSHRYVAYRYRKLLGIERDKTNVITLHLGNGCSAAAIRAGDSVDTSMGMTPLEGLVMGTRSGDIDPAIIDFIAAKEGLTPQEMETIAEQAVGAARHLRCDERHARAVRRSRASRATGARGSRSIFSATASASTSAPTSPRWAGRTRSSSPAASARTRPRYARASARGWRWMGVELDPARNAETRRAARRTHQPRRLKARRLRHPDRRGTAHRARHGALRARRAAKILRYKEDESRHKHRHRLRRAGAHGRGTRRVRVESEQDD